MNPIAYNSFRLVEYDKDFLERSWEWLNDPEIRALTLTPIITRDMQRDFFESLKVRKDYLIWGVTIDHMPIGAAGLKNHRDSLAEYWGYIGQKEFWGRGVGRQMVSAVEAKARDAGFRSLDLKVWKENRRAIALYLNLGYQADKLFVDADVLRMMKSI